MPEVQRPKDNRGPILLVIGALCILFGLFLFSQRLGLAEICLGANFLFGIPISNADALKVLVVAIGTSLVVFKGIVIVAAGLILLSKNGAVASERTAASTHH